MSKIALMRKHKTNRHCGDVVFVVELYDLDLRRGGCLEGGVVGIHEIEHVRKQNHEIDPVSILNKGVEDVLYHCSVGFDTGRRSATKYEQKIHPLGVLEHGETTVQHFVAFFT